MPGYGESRFVPHRWDFVSGMHDIGALYIALGRPYLAMALLSASTLRQTNPDIPIKIVTNVVDKCPDVGFWKSELDIFSHIDCPTMSNRTVKTNLLAHSPFRKTIYLDCDTKILGDLTIGSVILDYFDLGFRLNPYPQISPKKGCEGIMGNLKINQLPHWNSGVILFRDNALTARFFLTWSRLYEEYGSPYDQVSLVEAIFQSEARVLSLEARWNATDPVFNRAAWRRRTRVFHYATNISNKIFSEIMSFDRLIGVQEIAAEGQSTADWLWARRREKLKLGWPRYLALRTLWWLSTPA